MLASSFCPDLNGPLCMPRWSLLPTHVEGVRWCRGVLGRWGERGVRENWKDQTDRANRGRKTADYCCLGSGFVHESVTAKPIARRIILCRDERIEKGTARHCQHVYGAASWRCRGRAFRLEWLLLLLSR